MAYWNEFKLAQINSMEEYKNIRLDTISALTRYINDGIPPGGFLTAVIQNDLKMAVSRADLDNQACLVAIVRLLYNHAPAGCWGRTGAVEDWCRRVRQAKDNE